MTPLPDIVRAYIEAYNARDVERMLACLADDVVFENVAGGVPTARAEGREAFAAMARRAASVFRERRQTVTAVVAAGDRTAAQIEFRAVVAADLPNGWTAGQEIRFGGASFFRTAGGLIREIVDVS